MRIIVPMVGEWEALLDAINERLSPPPLAIYLPSKIDGASRGDAELLRALWDSIGARGIPILPPQD